MSRKQRSYLPGAVFHLTARTQGHEPWFTTIIRSQVVGYLEASFSVCDAALLAFAIMPNHLHLVVQQGEWSLGRVMQPLLRRVARLVQQTHGVEGHVFERRFRDTPCLSPDHIRNAIVYTHLNPLRAGLVEDPTDFHPATSHRLYTSNAASRTSMYRIVAVEAGLRTFAPTRALCMPQLRQAYALYVRRRIEMDAYLTAASCGDDGVNPPPLPPVAAGDAAAWRMCLPAWRADRSGRCGTCRPGPHADMGDIVVEVLAAHGRGIRLDDVRTATKRRSVVAVRRKIVEALSAAGYPGRSIARYLRVSDQCVSATLMAARRGCQHPHRESAAAR